MQGLEQEIKATMQMFVDHDIKDHGAVQPGTLETLAVQGYEYRDGKVEQTVFTEPPAQDNGTEPTPSSLIP